MSALFVSAYHLTMRPARADRSDATPRSIIAIWSERIRFRWQLAQMARANPHLIDDVGLTPHQVEAEIAKPFWQA